VGVAVVVGVLVSVGVGVRVSVAVLVGAGVEVALGVQVGGYVGAGVKVKVIVGIPARRVAAIAVARLGLKGLKKTLGLRKIVNRQINVKMISPIIMASSTVNKLPKFDIHSLL
jgi:hypothetical protein